MLVEIFTSGWDWKNHCCEYRLRMSPHPLTSLTVKTIVSAVVLEQMQLKVCSKLGGNLRIGRLGWVGEDWCRNLDLIEINKSSQDSVGLWILKVTKCRTAVQSVQSNLHILLYSNKILNLQYFAFLFWIVFFSYNCCCKRTVCPNKMQMNVNTVGNSAFSVNPFLMLHEKNMQMSFGLGYMALTDSQISFFLQTHPKDNTKRGMLVHVSAWALQENTIVVITQKVVWKARHHQHMFQSCWWITILLCLILSLVKYVIYIFFYIHTRIWV